MKKYMAFALTASMLVTGCASHGVDIPAEGVSSLTEVGAADSVPAIAYAATEDVPAIAYAATEIALEDVPAEPQILTAPPDLRIEAVDEMVASVSMLTKGTASWSYVTEDGKEMSYEACGAGPEECDEMGLITARIDPSKLTKNPKLLPTHGGEIVSVTRYCNGQTSDIDFTAEGELLLPKTSEYAVYDVHVKYPQGSCWYFFVTCEDERSYGGSDNSGSSDSSASVPPAEALTSPYDPNEVQISAAFVPVTEPQALGEYELRTYPANIYRTDGYVEGRKYPYTEVIGSVEELEAYLASAREDYQVGNMNVSDYDSAYFENNALLLAVLEEGSGSVTHEVLGITEDLALVIGRHTPEIGTCDMAEYHVAVELPAELAEESFSVEFCEVGVIYH